MTQPPEKPLRADARRNRGKIVEAARAQITLHGPDVGMDEIAAAAGVAVGTLYSHFPTKVHLVASVVSEFLAQVADRSETAAAAVRDGSPAYTELTALLRDIVIATATNQAAKAAAAALDADEGDASDAQRAGSALQSIINQARVDRTVRSDLSIEDFYLLVHNIPAGQPTDTLDRWIDLLLHGIAARAAHRNSTP
ncbi:TetR/AcrR family transcriptional regulator [Conyzicola sp.]|uniref:TetR/AcrR family transcriptional regulator n=1 Tax=Conyzicola sp. TaxID=1969404 RepID=UPI003988F591